MGNTPIDALGQRLQEQQITEGDIRMLDEYRRGFSPAYDTVMASLREGLGLKPTGRQAKSTKSIIEKLRRQPGLKLRQIQDIAGCRVVVPDVREQDRVTMAILEIWKPNIKLVDRRARPTFGYRAVHLVPMLDGTRVEIQVRTQLQHLWAQLSEKLADLIDPAIKYGGGSEDVRNMLHVSSSGIGQIEAVQQEVYKLKTEGAILEHRHTSGEIHLPDELAAKLADQQSRLAELERNAAAMISDLETSLLQALTAIDRARRQT